MVFLDFVLILLIAAVAGGIGRLLAGDYPGGLLASIWTDSLVPCQEPG